MSHGPNAQRLKATAALRQRINDRALESPPASSFCSNGRLLKIGIIHEACYNSITMSPMRVVS